MVVSGSILILFLIIGIFIIAPSIVNKSTAISNLIIAKSEDLVDASAGITTFDNSTPQATAISIARLNDGTSGFEGDTVNSAYLTSDGKYWIVKMGAAGYDDWIVTIDAKTLMSKSSINSGIKQTKNKWRSFDELKAGYIAEIQAYDANGGVDEPIKITMDNKEIWKVPVYYYHEFDPKRTAYIYVDVATGKSKNTLPDFNSAAGTDGWLTLKQVDYTVNKINSMHDVPDPPFKDALRDLYPE